MILVSSKVKKAGEQHSKNWDANAFNDILS